MGTRGGRRRSRPAGGPRRSQRLDLRAVRRDTAVTAESARWSSLAERTSWRSAATARRWTSNRASGSAMAISSHLRSLTDRRTHMFSVPSSQLAGWPQTACRRIGHPSAALLPARWRSNRTGGKVNGGRATWTVAGTRISSQKPATEVGHRRWRAWLAFAVLAALSQVPPAGGRNLRPIALRGGEDPLPRPVPLGVADVFHLVETGDRVAHVPGVGAPAASVSVAAGLPEPG